MPRKSERKTQNNPQQGQQTRAQYTARKVGDRLTPAQEEYCRLRASGVTQQASYTGAFPHAIRWTIQTQRTRAWELENTPAVRARIDAIRAVAERESEVSVARLQQELAHVALFDVRQLVDASGALKKLTELDDATARALSGLDIVQIGNADVGVGVVLKFRTNSKISAITELLKLRGAYERDNAQKGAAVADGVVAGVKAFLGGLASSGECALPISPAVQPADKGTKP